MKSDIAENKYHQNNMFDVLETFKHTHENQTNTLNSMKIIKLTVHSSMLSLYFYTLDSILLTDYSGKFTVAKSILTH